MYSSKFTYKNSCAASSVSWLCIFLWWTHAIENKEQATYDVNRTLNDDYLKRHASVKDVESHAPMADSSLDTCN